MDIIYEKEVILLTPTHSTVQHLHTHRYRFNQLTDSCRLLLGSKRTRVGGRGGTSQDFSNFSHLSQVSALTHDSRVIAQKGDWRLILLLSVTIAVYINILAKFHLAQWQKVEEKVKLIFESCKIYWLDSTQVLWVKSNLIIFWVES